MLGQLAESHRAYCLVRAAGAIRRLGMDTVLLDPEDAVNGTLLLLCRRIKAGTIAPITNSETFEMAFAPALNQFLVDWQRYIHAQKRGHANSDMHDLLCDRMRVRGGVTRRFGDLETEMPGTSFDVIDRRARPPDEPVMDEERVRSLLALLDGEGPLLREVAVLMTEGLTREEIARKLGEAISTIARKVQRIRAILRPLMIDHD